MPGASNQLLSVANGGAERGRWSYTAAGALASNDNGSGTVLELFLQPAEPAGAGGEPQGIGLAQYQQNFLGERVAKSAAKTDVTQFHYDRAGHLIAESDNLGNVHARASLAR